VPQRAAAFKVLKQSHSPSVLVELGYLSHPEDEKLLNAPAWHKQTATAIAGAIETYFSKRTAGPSVP
jgi:N-acetylmuramoyl-L-alanine amidase